MKCSRDKHTETDAATHCTRAATGQDEARSFGQKSVLYCLFPVLVAVLAVGGCLRTELTGHQMRCQEHMDCLLSHDNSTWMLLADTEICHVPLSICFDVVACIVSLLSMIS